MSLPAEPTSVLLVLAVAVLVGATVQSLVGLGLGLVAAPITALAAPELVPVLPITLAMLLPVATLARERADIDWRALAWLVPSRVPGTVVGVAVVALVGPRVIGIAVAVMVLVAVTATAYAPRLPITPTTLIGAGLASGVAGTATSIGGPPTALLLQHRPARQLRTTLAVFFLVGAVMSLVGLWLSGELEVSHLFLALVMAPLLLVGEFAGRRLRPVLPTRASRRAVLAVCGLSALVLLVRSLSG
ncbi:sulfite exporter TauE/SafE family protein [Nocardioidaceae bacterium]|nr:sulfite exporter TauE/SafE family protein [Nocardioidaceae bacterium]